ncbi:MAG TPA: hypothetical protein DEF47_12905 [Herpetosiphon sp.]|uniref:Uncharacterized protein n=1 Tax=Herpetosiphon aurantiacus (strain ATCC 23779 / DSM 785 / 114-95) TaxID=316274 RepID=A9AV30_HERA2|nr:hypothetical protein [Herpetosiphon sp.]ABX03108.1 hypothetical protein Haur_0457 [Herpetosiphon aurantiacus DSM 785]HBW50790.1 hypothetical protein [Herpetosiphon sp.]
MFKKLSLIASVVLMLIVTQFTPVEAQEQSRQMVLVAVDVSAMCSESIDSAKNHPCEKGSSISVYSMPLEDAQKQGYGEYVFITGDTTLDRLASKQLADTLHLQLTNDKQKAPANTQACGSYYKSISRSFTMGGGVYKLDTSVQYKVNPTCQVSEETYRVKTSKTHYELLTWSINFPNVNVYNSIQSQPGLTWTSYAYNVWMNSGFQLSAETYFPGETHWEYYTLYQ